MIEGQTNKGVVFRRLIALLVLGILSGCANFRKLGADLEMIEETYLVSAAIENRSQFPNDVYGLVVEWENGGVGKVRSADFCKVGNLGVFGFGVSRAANQYLLAFSDTNGNAKYELGEPAWISSGADGAVAPARFDVDGGKKARLRGRLSTSTVIPQAMIVAARDFRGVRTAAEAATGWTIPVALGDIADIDDPKFASQLGEEGLWQPISFPMKRSIGIYFLEKYDPTRTPVLFVYGASGSPQDWRTVFSKLDRSKYQAWFYFYPTGARLAEAGSALNRAVNLLHNHYQFPRMHLVAHSMGGLVSRSFLVENVLEGGNGYIDKFVSISTPWNGHKAAEMGVKRAPKVVPSWHDMQTDSPFQQQIFSKRLKGSVDHLLLYGHRDSKSRKPSPHETDGTVSVASMTHSKATSDAVEVIAYDEDHVSILSNAEVIAKMHAFLGGPSAATRPGERIGERLKRLNPLGD